MFRLVANAHADAPIRDAATPPTSLLLGCAVEVWQRLHVLFPRAVEARSGVIFMAVIAFLTGRIYHWSRSVAVSLARLTQKCVDGMSTLFLLLRPTLNCCRWKRFNKSINAVFGNSAWATTTTPEGVVWLVTNDPARTTTPASELGVKQRRARLRKAASAASAITNMPLTDTVALMFVDLEEQRRQLPELLDRLPPAPLYAWAEKHLPHITPQQVVELRDTTGMSEKDVRVL
jgi:hypothetical protein